MEEQNNEMELNVVNETDDEEEEDNGVVKKIIFGAAAIGTAAVTAVVFKKLKVREKINERRIRKLEKAGYVVAKVDESDEGSDVEVEDEEE